MSELSVGYSYKDYDYVPIKSLSEDGLHWEIKHNVMKEGKYVARCSDSPYFIGIDTFKGWVDAFTDVQSSGPFYGGFNLGI